MTPLVRLLLALGLVLGFAGNGSLHLALVHHDVEDTDAGGLQDCAVCQISHHSLGEAPQEPPTEVLTPARGHAPLPIGEPRSRADSLPAPPRAPPVLS